MGSAHPTAPGKGCGHGARRVQRPAAGSTEWLCAAAVILTLGLLAYSVRQTLWGAGRLADARRDAERRRRQLMREAGMCPNCGHTVRVKTDRCPECGSLGVFLRNG